jgi:phage terminase small subunit
VFNEAKLNNKPHVRAAIQYLMKKVAERIEVTADRILQGLAAIAFTNMKDVASWGPGGVVVKESDSLSLRASTAIAEAFDTPKRGRGVKLHDKLAALKLLGEHLGIFGKDASAPQTPVIKVYAGIDPSKV